MRRPAVIRSLLSWAAVRYGGYGFGLKLRKFPHSYFFLSMHPLLDDTYISARTSTRTHTTHLYTHVRAFSTSPSADSSSQHSWAP
jgi:hypothetical protein